MKFRLILNKVLNLRLMSVMSVFIMFYRVNNIYDLKYFNNNICIHKLNYIYLKII